MWDRSDICIQTCMHVVVCDGHDIRVPVYMHTCVGTCVCACIHMVVCDRCVCVCIYMCVCIYIYIYIYTDTNICQGHKEPYNWAKRLRKKSIVLWEYIWLLILPLKANLSQALKTWSSVSEENPLWEFSFSRNHCLTLSGVETPEREPHEYVKENTTLKIRAQSCHPTYLTHQAQHRPLRVASVACHPPIASSHSFPGERPLLLQRTFPVPAA